MSNSLATKEDITLIRMVLAELSRRFEEDKSLFSCSVNRWRADLDDQDGNRCESFEDVGFKNARTKVDLDYRPERNNQSQSKDIHCINVNWTTQTGEFYVFLSYLQPSTPGNRHRQGIEHDCSFYIGMGNKSLDGEYSNIKREFVALFKKIKEYTEVEIPRRQREAFENAVYETFPTLLDEVLMESKDDAKES